MLDLCDKLLCELLELAKKRMEFAKLNNQFNKELAESVGIVLSLAYQRFGASDD